ncbi:MAG: PAS domain S-box protein [Nitrospirae bacterium]|nr:MAG: PAS domain S-box protein [Nitrospirota bacterium]
MRNLVSFRSLAAKYIFMSLIILLFFAAYSLAVLVFVYFMNGDAKKINLAGRERMLTLDFTSHLHFITISKPSSEREIHAKGAEKAMDEYEEILYALKNGSDKLGLEPVHSHDHAAISQLKELIDLWQTTQRPLLRSILRSPAAGGNESCNACHSAVRDNTGKIEALVKHIETHHDREISHFNTAVFSASGLLVAMTIFLFAFARKSLIKPVQSLKYAASEIEKGNFGVSVDVKSRDEIGELSDTFNSMSLRLKMLFSEQEGHLYEMNMLNEIARVASQSLDLYIMLGQVMDAILQQPAFARVGKGAVFLADPDSGVLRIAVVRNFSEAQKEMCGVLRPGECLCGLCFREGEVILTKQSMGDERHSMTYVGMQEHGHAILPLKSRGNILGVLSFYLPAGVTLQPEEQKLYRSIADIVAVSVQNALNHRQVAMLAQALESSMDLIVIIDAEGNILHVNPQAEKYLGYTHDQLKGKHVSFMRIRRGSQAMWEDIIAQTKICGKWQGEVITVRKDGSEYPVLLSTSLVKYETNAVIALIGIARDITEQKSSEEALRESEARYHLLFDLLPYGGEVLDVEGRIVDCSISDARLLGYDEDELIGKHILELLHPASVAEFRQKFPTLMKGINVETQVKMIRKNGVIIDVLRAARPIMNSEGTVTGALALSVDITDKIRAEDEYRRLQSQFLQSQKLESIGRLASGIAHDFNNILSVIIGYSDLSLRELPPDSPLRASFDIISDAGLKAAALTRQLLAFSRKQTLELKVLNPKEIIENMVKMLGRMMGEDIVMDLSMHSTRYILADIGQIEQILMNLVVNARDAMPCGGRLILSTEDSRIDENYARGYEDVKPGDYVLLSVTDTGTGMSKDVQEHIFEPFFTTKEQGKGTGLGLATVYGIVKQHNGYIWVYSEPGKGTTFKVFLPAVTGTRSSTHAEVEGPLERGSETIMVVDDDPAVRTMIRDALLQLGYHIITASCGEEALQILATEERKPELLLTDAIMPRMSGKELADAALKILPGMKIVFMSGYPDESIAHQGILIPGVVYIQKPLMLDSLARKVRVVLDGTG